MYLVDASLYKKQVSYWWRAMAERSGQLQRREMDHLKDLYVLFDDLYDESQVKPQIMPRGMEYGQDLLFGLCKTDMERDLVKKSIQAYVTQHAIDLNQCQLVVLGHFDFSRKCFVLSKVDFFTPEQYQIHNFQEYVKKGRPEHNETRYHTGVALGHAIQTILRAFPVVPVAIEDHILDETMEVSQCIIDLLLLKRDNRQKSS